MRVWIDQDLCTGDGLCVDHCPDVFSLLEDGIAYVVENGEVLNDPGGSGSLARVSERNIADTIHAAELRSTRPDAKLFSQIRGSLTLIGAMVAQRGHEDAPRLGGLAGGERLVGIVPRRGHRLRRAEHLQL